jgi:hypothetical protein
MPVSRRGFITGVALGALAADAPAPRTAGGGSVDKHTLV